MRKLDKLIKEFCPNGVKTYILNDICNVYDGTHQTPKYTTSGIKFASVENIKDLYRTTKYISEEDYKKYKIKPQKNDVLMTRIGKIGECAVIESNEPLAYYVSLALLRPNQEIINSKYLKYTIESLKGRKELYKRTLINAVPIKINMGDIGKISIAVPPLEVQCEIVHILDHFTLLSAELSAELKARQKQFNYYFNKILNNDGYPKMKIGDIGQVKMCKRILKSQTNMNSGIPFYKIGTFGKEADAYISEETFNKYKSKYSYPKKGDILISCSGTIGRTVVFDGKSAYFQDSNIVWLEHDNSKIINEYLLYCYMTNPWKVSTGGTIARLYNYNILRSEIPVPSIEEQRKIVKILDKFYKISNDISEGLPAEIEARQKQYEYYRDKLLTFKELKANE